MGPPSPSSEGDGGGGRNAKEGYLTVVKIIPHRGSQIAEAGGGWEVPKLDRRALRSFFRPISICVNAQV